MGLGKGTWAGKPTGTRDVFCTETWVIVLTGHVMVWTEGTVTIVDSSSVLTHCHALSTYPTTGWACWGRLDPGLCVTIILLARGVRPKSSGSAKLVRIVN